MISFYKNKKEKGFVALFTVLITSIILAMALGIASISIKEISLSSSALEGGDAFYSADSGIECALYLSFNNTSLSDINDFDRCNGLPLILDDSYSSSDASESIAFFVSLGETGQEKCSYITIERGFNDSSLGYDNRIESKGSNTSCDISSGARRVERSIRVTY